MHKETQSKKVPKMHIDKEEIIRKIKLFRENIKGKFGVEKLIVFGSVERNAMEENSDVDIIVMSNKYGTQQFLKITPKLYNEWHLKPKRGSI